MGTPIIGERLHASDETSSEAAPSSPAPTMAPPQRKPTAEVAVATAASREAGSRPVRPPDASPARLAMSRPAARPASMEGECQGATVEHAYPPNILPAIPTRGGGIHGGGVPGPDSLSLSPELNILSGSAEPGVLPARPASLASIALGAGGTFSSLERAPHAGPRSRYGTGSTSTLRAQAVEFIPSAVLGTLRGEEAGRQANHLSTRQLAVTTTAAAVEAAARHGRPPDNGKAVGPQNPLYVHEYLPELLEARAVRMGGDLRAPPLSAPTKRGEHRSS